MLLSKVWLWLWCIVAPLSVVVALVFALWPSEQASLDFQWDAARVLLYRTNPYALALHGQNPNLLPDAFAPNQFPSVFFCCFGNGINGQSYFRVVIDN